MQPPAPPRVARAVLLVSAALILFQISYTRLVGYRLFYHFVFVAIGLSLLGLGAAGSYVAVARRRGPADQELQGWLLALLAAIPICFLAMANPPIGASTGAHAFKLLGASAIAYLLWTALFMVLLNFLGGVVLARIFTDYNEQMGALYARDLVGAALGCLGAVALMKYGSPPLAFLAATVPVLLAVWAFRGAARPRLGPAVMAGATLVAAAILLGPPSLSAFDGFGAREQRAVIKHEWNHLVRTDHREGEYILDGDAGTPVVVWNEEERARPVTDPAFVVATSSPSVAIVGFGGGPQVAEALRAGASSITAVDINPTIARWVVGEDSQLNGGLFLDPRITLVTGEGRHAVRAAGRRFDVISMHAIDTYAAAVAGAYALTENFLYTKEAASDWLDALEDGGVMTIRRWLFNPPRENMRLFVTALEALAERGVAEPEAHLVVIAPVTDYDAMRTGKVRAWGWFMLFSRPVTPAQLARLQAHVERMGWSFLHAPGLRTGTPFDTYARTSDRRAFRDAYPYFIEPVTDASPYLFQFYNPLHPSAYRTEGDWAVSGVYQSSSVTLLASLLASILLSAVIIVGPLLRRRSGTTPRAGALLYFACLGLGFMALEVPLTQILALYLGHPTYGFSVVLVALLLSTGAGSALVARLDPARNTRWIVQACTAIAALLVVFMVTIFPLVHGTIAWPDPVRFAVALAITAVAGVPMGLPLALAVRRMRAESVPWAWAVNGAFSVIASSLVMIVMVYFGTQSALALGAAAYAGAAMLAQASID